MSIEQEIQKFLMNLERHYIAVRDADGQLMLEKLPVVDLMQRAIGEIAELKEKIKDLEDLADYLERN